ncbi:MAG: DoxX family protein [Longimicrobiales bacterium]|jgi:hypothetical protein
MPKLSILSLLQVLVGLGLLNVWLVRARSATGYRGGAAKTLREEFQAYGLPDFAFYVVGGLKIVASLALVIGLWVDLPVRIAGGIVALLMVGALMMHVKVGDPPMRLVPAALMLLMCVGIILLG